MRLTAVPPHPDEFATWNAHQIRDYAKEKVAAGTWKDAEALIRAEVENKTLLPQGFATTGHHIRRIEDHDTGQLIAWIWVALATEGPPDLAWLFDIEILPEHRGKGLGRSVMQLAETEAKALGCTRLGLHVFAINKVAHHLYESSGYNVTDLSMVKTLV